MLHAYELRVEQQRWDMAYWVANMVSVHTKKPIQPTSLMEPLLPKKSLGEKKKETEEFFKSFERQRNEVTQDGNSG